MQPAKWQPANAFRQGLKIKALMCYCLLEPPCAPPSGTGAHIHYVVMFTLSAIFVKVSTVSVLGGIHIFPPLEVETS